MGKEKKYMHTENGNWIFNSTYTFLWINCVSYFYGHQNKLIIFTCVTIPPII